MLLLTLSACVRIWLRVENTSLQIALKYSAWAWNVFVPGPVKAATVSARSARNVAVSQIVLDAHVARVRCSERNLKHGVRPSVQRLNGEHTLQSSSVPGVGPR